MTIREAKDTLSRIGVTLNKRNGEFRVNLARGKEKTAYYTTMENPTDPFGMLPDHEGELNYMEEL